MGLEYEPPEERRILLPEDLPDFKPERQIHIQHIDSAYGDRAVDMEHRGNFHPEIADQIEVARTKVIDFMRWIDPNEKNVSAWLHIFGELVLNALEHGNSLNPNKPCIVSYDVQKKDMVLHVKDSGDGFDVDERLLYDPGKPENLASPSGRGIFMTSHFAHQVLWNEKGNEVAAWRPIEKPA